MTQVQHLFHSDAEQPAVPVPLHTGLDMIVWLERASTKSGFGKAPIKNRGPIKNQFGFLPVEMSSKDVGS